MPDYATDADVVYKDQNVVIYVASLYVLFNVKYLSDRNICGIINMFGFDNVVETYVRDSTRYSSYMTTVAIECAEQIAYLVRYGGPQFIDHYKHDFRIDVFHIEGVEDSWNSNIQDYFCTTSDFIRAQMGRTKPAKVLINCYSGYNRSATIAVAFLLSYTRQPLRELLAMLLPERQNMLSRPSWPSQIQSKYVKELLLLGRHVAEKLGE